MSIAWLMLFGGSILVVAGWKNLSVSAASRGDFTTPTPRVTGATGTVAR